ncbi:cytochrome c oxidase assembly protein [Dermabacteraceae bacterium P13077]
MKTRLVSASAPLIAVLAAYLGLILTGAAFSYQGALIAPSPLVTWGLPLVRIVHHTAMIYVIGCLWLVCLLLPAQGRARAGALDGPRATLTRYASYGAFVWAAASVAMNMLSYLEAIGTGTPLTASFPRFLGGFWEFATTIELGQIYLVSAFLVLVAAQLLFFARRINTACWGLAFAMLALLLLGLAGHAGSSTDHANAVNALAVHIAATAIWVGPLAVMVLHCRTVGEYAQVALERFSPWAFAAVIAIAFSGLVNALVRMNGPAELLQTPYGRVVFLKLIGLLLLAGFGAWQRRRQLRADAGFARLAAGEAVVMAAVVGLSVALGRSAPPVPQTVPGNLRVESLLGYPAPEAPFTLVTLFTSFQPDWMMLGAACTMALLYLLGVRRLRRRGDAWQPKRTVFWLLGCLAFAWVMNGGPAAYGMILFHAHMVQHMALMMVVPPLLVLGAPVTLLSRAVAPRTDGSRGVREWVLVILHSRYARLLSYAPVAGVIFAGSLVMFYFAGFFTLAMFYHAAHVFMTVHFLLSGYLFAWVLIGVDPSPHPLNHAMRLITLLVTLSFHAFFGVAVISSVNLIGASWYAALGMYGQEQLMLNQAIGGSIMWGISEIPTVLLGFGVVLQWTRDDTRKARQWDRKADRDGDAELKEYNERLARLNTRG